MKEKINIAELLKDCPTGMELDCVMYDNVSFDKVSDDKKASYPIFCYITDEKGNRSGISFTENGYESRRYGAKCVIFPKGKTTWEGFIPPCKFKDGDVISMESAFGWHTFIYNHITDKYDSYGYYAIITSMGNFKVNSFCSGSKYRLATEQEKEKLFNAIKANGYKWNPETKTLEKLSKFKVGDRVKHIPSCISGIVVKVDDKGYYIGYPKGVGVSYISFTLEKDYELVTNKFDITTLKGFDKVLVRDSNKAKWVISFFSHCNNLETYKYSCLNNTGYAQCIPYEGNEHLIDTTDDCDEYYKTWK